MNTKVYQRHEGSRTQPGIRRHWDSEMVSGRGIRGAPRHEDPHRQDDVNGTRRSVLRAKKNMKSSTEAELVGLDDLMPHI